MVWWCCRGPHLCVQAPGDEQLHRLAQWPAWRKRIGALEPPALGMYLAEMYYSVGLQLQRSNATKFAGALIRLARQIYVTSCGRHATLMPFALFLHHTFPRQPTCSSAAQVETNFNFGCAGLILVGMAIGILDQDCPDCLRHCSSPASVPCSATQSPCRREAPPHRPGLQHQTHVAGQVGQHPRSPGPYQGSCYNDREDC